MPTLLLALLASTAAAGPTADEVLIEAVTAGDLQAVRQAVRRADPAAHVVLAPHRSAGQFSVDLYNDFFGSRFARSASFYTAGVAGLLATLFRGVMDTERTTCALDVAAAGAADGTPERVEILAVLLAGGVDPNVATTTGPPLAALIRARDPEQGVPADALALLLDAGADPDLGGGLGPALVALGSRGRLQGTADDLALFERLQAAGADVTHEAVCGAVAEDDGWLVSTMLERGGSLDEQCGGESLAHFALSRQAGASIAGLLDAGLQPDSPGTTMPTLLLQVLGPQWEEPARLAAVRALAEAGADPGRFDEDGQTAVVLADRRSRAALDILLALPASEAAALHEWSMGRGSTNHPDLLGGRVDASIASAPAVLEAVSRTPAPLFVPWYAEHGADGLQQLAASLGLDRAREGGLRPSVCGVKPTSSAAQVARRGGGALVVTDTTVMASAPLDCDRNGRDVLGRPAIVARLVFGRPTRDPLAGKGAAAATRPRTLRWELGKDRWYETHIGADGLVHSAGIRWSNPP